MVPKENETDEEMEEGESESESTSVYDSEEMDEPRYPHYVENDLRVFGEATYSTGRSRKMVKVKISKDNPDVAMKSNLEIPMKEIDALQVRDFDE